MSEILLSIYKMALSAIAKDKYLKCKCGEYPYEDGEYCPKCTARFALQADSKRR